jgi:superfamily II DNA or RNA helicase
VNNELASRLIEKREGLLYLTWHGGPYFLCHYPYDMTFTDKLRVIPSFTWRKSLSAWRVHYLDLPILEAQAFTGGYTVKYEPTAQGKLAVLRDDYRGRRGIKQAEKFDVPALRPLRNYQTVGSYFMFRTCELTGGVLNADAMGCLDGSTEIILNRGGKGFRMTMENLYISFHGGRTLTGTNRAGGRASRGGKIWDNKIPTMTRSMIGDHFALNRIKDVVKKGVRETILVKTDGGKSIIATPDHVFFTPKGEVPVGSLEVGSSVYVNGRPTCYHCGETRLLTHKKFAGACMDCVYKHLRRNTVRVGETIDKNGYVYVSARIHYHPRRTSSGVFKHRLVYEAAINKIPYKEYLLRLERGDINGIKFLGRKDVVHHIDGDVKNNTLGNLELDTPRSHALKHSKENTLKLWNVMGPKVETIVSIEKSGKRVVYDIMMEGPYHSFIANGFVVHNSGKTAQAIGAVILTKNAGRPHKTLILCPTSVKSAWLKEIDVVCGMKALSITGGMAKRLEQYEVANQYDFLVCSYQTLLSDHEEIAEKFKPNILIFDECHRISNRTNKITQLMIGGKNKKKTFREIAPLHSVYLLTGTPISNRLEDLYPMLKLMDPGILSWTGFKNRYAEIEKGERWDRKFDVATKKMKPFKREFDTIVGYQNERELKAKLSLHMIRRTKDEVLPELPPKIFQTLDIELSAEERKIYNELKRDFKATIRGMDLEVENRLAWMTRAQQICDSLEIIPGSKAKKSSKLEELIRIVNENAQDRKIVIFSRFSEMTKIICRELKHLKPLHLHGGVPDEKRGPLIDAFQEDPQHRVFVSTLGAGGVGITLTAADLCILYDRWWAPGGNFQAVDRLHRSGQKKTVNVIILRVNNSVEEHVEKTWLTKQGIVQDMVGDEKVIGALTRKEMAELL